MQNFNSIRLKNFLTKDTYKEKSMQQKEKSLKKQKQKKAKILKQSSIRFQNSPFSTNYVALNEIFEIKQKFNIQSKTTRSKSKTVRVPSKPSQNYLKTLRINLKSIENSNSHSEERKLEAALHKKTKTSEALPKLKTNSKLFDSLSLFSRDKTHYSTFAV